MCGTPEVLEKCHMGLHIKWKCPWPVWLSWLEHHSINWKVMGSIPSQTICLRVGVNPLCWCVQEATDQCFSQVRIKKKKRKWREKLPWKTKVSLPVDISHWADFGVFLHRHVHLRENACFDYESKKGKFLKPIGNTTHSMSTYYLLSIVSVLYGSSCFTFTIDILENSYFFKS